MRPNSSILVSSDQRILLFFFCKLHAGFHLSFSEERQPSGHSAIKPRSVECCSDGFVSPISTLDLWSSVRATSGFLGTSLTKALLPQLLSLARRPALGAVLVVPNIFHLRGQGALGDFLCGRFVFVAFPRSVSRHNPAYELCRMLLPLHDLVFALKCIVSLETLDRGVCLSKSCPVNWI